MPAVTFAATSSAMSTAPAGVSKRARPVAAVRKACAHEAGSGDSQELEYFLACGLDLDALYIEHAHVALLAVHPPFGYLDDGEKRSVNGLTTAGQVRG